MLGLHFCGHHSKITKPAYEFSVCGMTNVDPKGYLAVLNSMKITSDAEISDFKKARLLL